MDKQYPYTAEQREQHARFWRYIAREDLRRIMNDTKWREALQVLRSLPPDFPVWFRTKEVMGPETRGWESVFPWHFPSPYAFIEWADFRTVVTTREDGGMKVVVDDRTDDILGGFRSHNVPFTFSRDAPNMFVGGVVRIWGYLRPGSEVAFASDDPRDA
jgi:hypothetical protein